MIKRTPRTSGADVSRYYPGCFCGKGGLEREEAKCWLIIYNIVALRDRILVEIAAFNVSIDHRYPNLDGLSFMSRRNNVIIAHSVRNYNLFKKRVMSRRVHQPPYYLP